MKPQRLFSSAHQDNEGLVASGGKLAIIDTSNEPRLRPPPWTTDEVRALVSLTLVRAYAAKGYCSRSMCRSPGRSVCRSVGQSVGRQVSQFVCKFSLELWMR